MYASITEMNDRNDISKRKEEIGIFYYYKVCPYHAIV